MKYLNPYVGRLWAIASLTAVLSACGGGSGPASKSATYKGNFVDSPVKGMCYSASPSGIVGTTDAAGTYEFKAGDTVRFAIPNNGSCTSGSAIALGSAVAVDPSLTSDSLTHVLGLPNGRRMAEVLNALNVGTSDSMNISNLSIPPMQVSRLSNYINSGVLPADAADNASLLQSIQAAVTRPAGAAYALPVVPATFNNDVTTHLDTTLSRFISNSTIVFQSIVGKTVFQASSAGSSGGGSFAYFNSPTQFAGLSGYGGAGTTTTPSAFRTLAISMSGNKMDVTRPDGLSVNHVTAVTSDSQKMLYSEQDTRGYSGSGSLNFLTPLTLASVAGKRLTFDGVDSCNGVAMDTVFDFNANGTLMTKPAFTDSTMNVSTDSNLPGTLKLTNIKTGTVVYLGMSAGGNMSTVGTTLFYVTSSLNANVAQGDRGDDMKPFGSFKIKSNPVAVQRCEQTVSTGAVVGTVTAASGNGIKAFRGANAGTVMLVVGASILEGDIITTDGNTGTIDFNDRSFLRLDTNVTVEIRTATANKTIAEAILNNGSLWGRTLTTPGGNPSGGGLVNGVRG
jgi:hypothetical protein